MHLDASVVRRADLFRNPGHKEWWYVGWVDPDAQVYMSFHAVRLPALDSVTFTVFDPAANAPVSRSRRLFLTAPTGIDHTELRAGSGDRRVHYEGSSDTGW
ncbi:MAG: hypothetical protein ACK42I_09690, partial [Thermomicrobium sp.]